MCLRRLIWCRPGSRCWLWVQNGGLSADRGGVRKVREEFHEKEPLIIVVIASYNYARFLPRAFEAIKRQVFKDYEVLYCDDGSTDDSVAVIQSFIRDNPEMDIRLVQGENGGVVANKKRIQQNARGTYVMLCDAADWMADDCWEPRDFLSDDYYFIQTYNLYCKDAAFVRKPVFYNCAHGDNATTVLTLNGRWNPGKNFLQVLEYQVIKFYCQALLTVARAAGSYREFREYAGGLYDALVKRYPRYAWCPRCGCLPPTMTAVTESTGSGP